MEISFFPRLPCKRSQEKSLTLCDKKSFILATLTIAFIAIAILKYLGVGIGVLFVSTSPHVPIVFAFIFGTITVILMVQKYVKLKKIILQNERKREKYIKYSNEEPLSFIEIQSSSAQKDFILKLPKDLSLYIFSFFTKQELLQASLVCKSWKILTDNDALWQVFFLRDFPLETKEENELRKKYIILCKKLTTLNPDKQKRLLKGLDLHFNSQINSII